MAITFSQFDESQSKSDVLGVFSLLNYRYHMIFFTLVGSMFLLNSMVSLSLSKNKLKKDMLKNDGENEDKKDNVDRKVTHGFSRLDSAIDVQDSILTDNMRELMENPSNVSDDAIVSLLEAGKIAGYALEKTLKDFNRAVKIRRLIVCTFLIF
jgi:hypothetical protein